jgi:hypothetical protein
MAGVKVTDLTTLGTADPTDIMYIVDTTANQSKQIEVQDIYSGLPQFSSGEFTPTISGANDCLPTCLQALYSRVDNIVTCSYYMSITLDPTFTTGSYNISPPIASVFTGARDAFGVIGTITDPYADLVSSEISADIGFGQITHVIEILSAGSTLTYVVNMQYIIRP